MGRQKKKKPMVFFFKAVGIKPAAFVFKESVFQRSQYKLFLKGVLQ